MLLLTELLRGASCSLLRTYLTSVARRQSRSGFCGMGRNDLSKYLGETQEYYKCLEDFFILFSRWFVELEFGGHG